MPGVTITYVRTGAPRTYYAHDRRGPFAIVTRPHIGGGWTATSLPAPGQVTGRRMVIGAETRDAAVQAVR